jgi:voltage-gated potassium channel
MDPLVFRLRIFVFVLIGVLGLGTVGFVVAEGFSLTDAVYFTVVTVATVGYGDIHPVTTVGKMLAIALIVTGVGTFLGVIGNATEIMLNRREKEKRAQKLNMVQGLFFGEIGTSLIEMFVKSDPNIDALRQKLIVTGEWSRKDFASISSALKRYDFKVDPEAVDFGEIRSLLEGHKALLLRLLENPALLENESFTELLRATFHLNAELLSRKNLATLPSSDKAHLAGDVKRVYALLVDHWLIYVEHLKQNYPYLFSLAMRTNPFDSEATPEVR